MGRADTATDEDSKCTFLSPKMTDATATLLWYSQIQKPWFAPPSWVFGPVWSVLYILIAISFGYVFYQTIITRRWPLMIAVPFMINLAANLLFSPIQFQLQNNLLATIDILVILLTVPWMIRAVWQRAAWVAWMQLPYALWVGFATVVQISITWMNW